MRDTARETTQTPAQIPRQNRAQDNAPALREESSADDARVLRALVRGALFRRVELVAREDWAGLERLGDADEAGEPWTGQRWEEAMAPYWEDHDEVGIAAPARGPALFQVAEEGTTWRVNQVLDDPSRDHDWRIEAIVDLPASDENGEVRLAIRSVAPF